MGQDESVEDEVANYASTKKLLDDQAQSSEPDDENEQEPSGEQVQKQKTNEHDRSQLSHQYSKSLGLDKSGVAQAQTKQQPFKSNISNVEDESQDKSDGEGSPTEEDDSNDSEDFDQLAAIPAQLRNKNVSNSREGSSASSSKQRGAEE
jgi:hypothetical protein